MANTKISAMTAATDLVAATLPGIQGGANKRFPIALLDARFQPLDADLTAIAALTTTTYGRSLLTLAAVANLAAEVDSFFLTPTEGDAAYQPKDADLTTIAGLTATTDNFMQSKSSAWASRTPAQVNVDLNAAKFAFKANKNGTNQTGIVDGAATAVTFGTEAYDIGAAFASNAWTPPAGRVHISAQVTAFPAATWAAASQEISLKKNGTTIASNRFETAASATQFVYLALSVDDSANGTDVYSIEVTFDVASSTITIRGNTNETYFCGHQI